jgi:tetratricopeptide (TPR) repeat protein
MKTIVSGVACLIIGLAVGFYIANSINRSALTQQALTQNQPSAPFANQTQNPQQAQAMLGDVQETLDKAKNEPQNFDAQMKAGDMYAQIGRFDRALEFYEQANKLKPDDLPLIVKTGNAYFDSRQYEQAEKWYLKALAKKEDTNVRTDLGITFLERQNPDIDRAITEFQKSLQSDPKHLPAIYNLSLAYHRKGNTEESKKYMAKLDEINPQGELSERLRKILNQN